MRRTTLFTGLVFVLLCVVGVGFYRGWFVLASQGGDESGKVEVNLTVDSDKAKADAETVKDKARELTRGAADAAEENLSEPSEQGDTSEDGDTPEEGVKLEQDSDADFGSNSEQDAQLKGSASPEGGANP